MIISIVKCSKDENEDLYNCIPWSHGTLGFLVSAEIQIVRCKPYVLMKYLPYKNKEDAMKKLDQESRAGTHDFVECLVYSQAEYVIMLADMTDNSTLAPINAIGKWYKEWFFTHVKKVLIKNEIKQEIIPLRDYYHRHTKSLFWEMQDIVPFGNTFLFRWIMGWSMPPKPALLKLTQTESLRRLYELHHVVQDMLVPMKDLSKCIDVFHEEVNLYPLWVCPFKIPKYNIPGDKKTPKRSPENLGFVHNISADIEEMYVDVGAYGNPSVGKKFEAKATCRRLEDYVRKVKGYQMMYADSYMTK